MNNSPDDRNTLEAGGSGQPRSTDLGRPSTRAIAQTDLESEIREDAAIAAEIRILLSRISKRRRKGVLETIASTDGWSIVTSVPVQLISRTQPPVPDSTATIVAQKESKKAPQPRAAYKLTPEWKRMVQQHKSVVNSLKATQKGTEENSKLLAHLREVEANMKRFRLHAATTTDTGRKQ